MASVNRVFILGNLCADVELRYAQSGQAVANFRVATNESWTDKSGAKQERAEYHSIVAWAKTAELCAEYLKKGRSVHIEGKLQTRKWQDKEGKDRYTTEIVAERVTFLGGGEKSGGGRSRDSSSNSDAPPVDDADIPF